MTDTEATPETPRDRVIDTEGLKALAHPLRVALLEELSTYGPATASRLAQRLGESSGATSYHLRQLEKHRFVHEVEGRGSGRERWWARVPGGISVSTIGLEPGSAAFAAGEMISREWERHRGRLLDDFTTQGTHVLPESWIAGSMLTTSNLRLTVEQLAEVSRRMEAALDTIVDEFRGRTDAGSRPVQVHVNVFPVLDGEPTPEATAPDRTADSTPPEHTDAVGGSV